MKKPSNKGKRPYNVEYIVDGMRTIRTYETQDTDYDEEENVSPFVIFARRLYGPNGGCYFVRQDSYSNNGNWIMFQVAMGRDNAFRNVWVLKKCYDEVRYY